VSSSVLTGVNVILSLITLGVCLLGAYRAVGIGRGLVSRVTRSRAFWTGTILALLCLVFAERALLAAGINVDPHEVVFFLFILFLLPYIDGGVMAALDTDFFHRDTLLWRRLRKPAYIAFYVSSAVFTVFAASMSFVVPSSSPPFLLLYVVLIILGYGAVALVIAARRTADRTLRRHVGYLGLSLAGFIAQTFFFNPSSIYSSIAEDAVYLAAVYVLYRAVMSLSLVSRIVKEGSTTSKPEGAGVTPPGSP
jgi:hypothetical protein